MLRRSEGEGIAGRMSFASKSRSAGALAVGRLTDMVFPLIRAFLLARLLPQDQFGLAITLSVMAALVELSTDIGLDRYAVINPDPNSAKVRGTLHSLSVLRGALIGLVLVAIGPFAARAFDSPEAWWAFSSLGLASFLRGFMHLGVKEAMRDFRFWPEALTLATTQVAWTAVSVVLAWTLNDYRCMLIGIFCAQITFVAVSHLTSRTPWQLRWSSEDARKIVRFSLPLLPNGCALAFRNMADRLIVGAYMGLRETAVYNINMMVATMPSNIIQTFLTSLMLPVFAKHESGEQPIDRLYQFWPIALGAIAAIYGAGIMCLGEPMVTLIFGKAFSIDQLFLIVAGLIVAVKIINQLPVSPSLAVGDTKFVLFISMTALGAPLLGFIAANFTSSLNVFIVGMGLGDLIGLLWVTSRSQHRYGFEPVTVWSSIVVPLALLGGLGFILYETEPHLIARIGIFLLFALVCAAAILLALVRMGIPIQALLRRKPGRKVAAE